MNIVRFNIFKKEFLYWKNGIKQTPEKLRRPVLIPMRIATLRTPVFQSEK